LDAHIQVDIASHASLVHSFTQRAVHFFLAESDLVDFLDDKVAKDGNALAIFAIQAELDAACVLMNRDYRPAV